MATVYHLLPNTRAFYLELQDRAIIAEQRRHRKFMAVLLLQRMARCYLMRRYLKAFLAYRAMVIQRAFKAHRAKKKYRAALRRAVRLKHGRHYNRAAGIIQSLWRGHYSRRTKFCYKTYRRWLATIKERGEQRAAEAAEFGIRSRSDNLRILEEEARQWLAFVVFKLHHLLRIYVRAGVYSEPATTELSEFEKLLKSIHYTEYMTRLKRKYDEFVRKHRPGFSNKRLFPIIGDGADYWYLSLAEMYELTTPDPNKKDNRHKATHHGQIHKQPFLWRKLRPPVPSEGRGPFTPPISPSPSSLPALRSPPPPAPTPNPGGDNMVLQKDPRYHLYVKHYTPKPWLFDYVNYHINVLVKRKCSIANIDIQ